MTLRVMGDATHDNVQSLVSLRPHMQLVAGYVTGSPGIRWTAADWALFNGMTAITVDQGFTGSPVPSANVRDFEALPGGGYSWNPATVTDTTGWTAPDPTIYANQWDSRLLFRQGWADGALWLAAPQATPPTGPPTHLFDGTPIPPGIRVVAQQWAFATTYDLSVVFDPVWPEREAPDMASPLLQLGWAFCTACGVMFYRDAPRQACPGNSGGKHVTPAPGAEGATDYGALYAR